MTLLDFGMTRARPHRREALRARYTFEAHEATVTAVAERRAAWHAANR
jgi:hypothetical protein